MKEPDIKTLMVVDPKHCATNQVFTTNITKKLILHDTNILEPKLLHVFRLPSNIILYYLIIYSFLGE